jgi:hypothetical protein
MGNAILPSCADWHTLQKALTEKKKRIAIDAKQEEVA